MDQNAQVRDEGGIVSLSRSEALCSLLKVPLEAFCGVEAKGGDANAEKGKAFIDGLVLALFGVESETEATKKIFDFLDVAFGLVVLVFGHNDDKIIDITAVVLVA